MPFIFHCPYCQSPMTVPDHLAGTAAACAGCRRPITLPAAPVVPGGPTPPVPDAAPQPATAAARPKGRCPRFPALAVVLLVLAVAGLVASGVTLAHWGASRRPARTAPVASESKPGPTEGTPAPPKAPATGAGAGATGATTTPVGTKYDGAYEAAEHGVNVSIEVYQGVMTSLAVKTDGPCIVFGACYLPTDGVFEAKGLGGLPSEEASIAVHGEFVSGSEVRGVCTINDTKTNWVAHRTGPAPTRTDLVKAAQRPKDHTLQGPTMGWKGP